MKNITVVLLLLATSILTSQNQPTRSLFTETGMVIFKNKEYKEDISGSVYLNKNWFSTVVLNTLNDKSYKIPRANFDVLAGKFVVKIANDSIYAIDNFKTKSVIFNNKKFELYNNQYYQRISEGNLNVFKKYKIKIVEGAKDAIAKIKITPDRYVIKETFYLKNNLSFEKLKISKKNILNSMEESKRNKVKKYAKLNSLKFKKEKDLIKILYYYNSI